MNGQFTPDNRSQCRRQTKNNRDECDDFCCITPAPAITNDGLSDNRPAAAAIPITNRQIKNASIESAKRSPSDETANTVIERASTAFRPKASEAAPIRSDVQANAAR